MNYVMDSINATEFIKELVDTTKISTSANYPNIAIHSAIGIPESAIIYGDKQRLTQALLNIINNGLRFTKEGSLTISCSFAKNNGDSGGGGAENMEIKIIDTGTGIPQELLPNLFQKFASKDPDGQAKQGTGLGLFISKSIIGAHHGTISASANQDRGTTFTIGLPVKKIAVNSEIKA
jgi:signal transduction histidine kinase